MRMFGSKCAGLAIALAGSAVALGVPAPANAQTVRWKQYLHPEKETIRQFQEFYLAGIRDGFFAYSAATHDKATMCPPPDKVLTTEQLDGIMKRWAETQAANPNLDVMPIGLVAINALRKEYPCR